ncbi:2Fe-2S iron-sulfur cluster-binding protein [Desertibacillus haloalkaliphilus]|uniref:2Fe-2S iron-sulfur cluster-binding protein n=1 Tax=Desertibacillus haloalkaliphilus TaxID=1328930 RepID=UPI001C2761E5|nr:2Fe-2S iron-sulfur cluster-binding protein [Desertibacillus haloalkaliphilus]MBU8908231.1 (2Fe-2S)-binding protein [Desertibacillus haloalkaliphilus]
MANIHIKNTDRTIEVEDGSNILRNSLRYDGEVPNRCGGGYCGTCLVNIEEGSENLDKRKPAEIKKLGEDILNKGYRLACQTFINEGDITISWDKDMTKQVQKRKVQPVKS